MKAKTKKDIPPEDEEKQEIAEEIEDAADETPTTVTPPELDARTEELTEWDDAPSAHGTAVPKVGPATEEEDEDSIASKLVYEGTDEADRERRMAAADPDFEP
ncbi:MAG TPA: hypothetical protein VGM54_17240 [Chthoniobacter sp.]